MDDISAAIRIGGCRINIRYADDTTLIAGNKKDLEKLITRVSKSNKARLKLNIKKTFIMTTSQDTSIKINELKMVDKINFLGVTISKTSSCT